ncbi:MAG: patatin-like phospholipase family protein, partial [Acidobacteriota bacterium]
MRPKVGVAAYLAVTVLLVLGAGLAAASAMADQGRPRTALVLSGGGARGAAHIGVLQVLEELNVPVDCVVGTSMGAIVGGLYAAGWTPDELDAELRRIDWADAFNDAPPRKQTSFRRKEDDFLALLPLELGIGKKGIRAPAGIIAGQKLGFMLKILTLRAAGAVDFDHLDVPFRAIAADLDDGAMVALQDGSLANAIRASMSIPGVFSPVEIDGQLLVDGGIVRNLPVDVGRELCGERVIAVDIGTPSRSVGEAPAFFSVMSQTLNVLNKRNTVASREDIRPSDLLIVPDLGDISAASFGRVGDAIDLGRQAARAAAAELEAFAVDPAEFQAVRARQRHELDWRLEAQRIHGLTVRGTERVDPRQITKRLRSRVGTLLDLETLREDLGRVYQMGDFAHVDFQFEPAPDGVELAIEVEEKSWGPGFLRPGLRLESNLEGDSGFLALASYRRTQLNRLGAEWKLLLTVGEENRLFTELFQPFDPRGFTFVAPYVDVREDELLDPSGPFGGVELTAIEVGVDFGIQLGNYGELRIGVETGSLEADSSILSNFVDVDTGGYHATLTIDHLDSTDFPRSGSLGRIDFSRSVDSLGADDEFDRLQIDWISAWSRGSNTIFASLDFGSELSSELPDYSEFSLGGFFNLSGLRPEALRGDVMGLGGLGFYHRFANGLHLGGLLEAGNVWPDTSDAELSDLIYSGLVFVGRQTFIGPMYIGYS